MATPDPSPVPDFIIAGASKAGTTALFHALGEHPKVFSPATKEPDFFANLPRSFKGVGDHVMQKRAIWDWPEYVELFKARKPGQICGEASVSYLHFHESANRIAAVNPDARIIIVLRNPVERAYSQYMYNRRDLRETLDFADALDSEEEREAAGWVWSWQYRKVGLYSPGVRAYLNAFGKERVFIGLFDDLKADSRAFLGRVLGFLGLDNDTDRGVAIRNISGEPRSRLLQQAVIRESAFKSALKAMMPLRIRARVRERIMAFNTRRIPMRKPDRQRLAAYYSAELRELEGLLGLNLDAWKT